MASRTPTRSDSEVGDAADLGLMRRIVLGDDAALAALMRVHWGALVGYAGQMLDDPDAGSDAVQQAFARLWETRAGWKPSGTVRGYLYRLVRNGAIDELRRRSVRSFWADRDELKPRAPATPLDEATDNEMHGALERALGSLPRKRREVLVLAHLQGLSYREIAEALGISVETVKKHVSLALTDLRRLLAPHFPGASRARFDGIPNPELPSSRIA
jgi:RNA polymerase sigma-70 factor (ECF subfamily)